jgi:hypothetical protein
MPNWCDNNLFLTHKDPKMVDKAIEGWKNNKFFGTLVPEPDYTQVKVKPTFPTNLATGEAKPEFVEPDQAWWDWRLQNWGTKWEIVCSESYFDIIENEDGKSIRCSFNTAWSPPTDWYATLWEQGYEIKAHYYEGGCAFCGTWEDGDEDFYNIEPPEGTKYSVWIKENIPAELDREMGISESYESFEDEEEEQDA